MNRKRFIKKAILGTAGISIAGNSSAEEKKNKLEEQVGFNHLPNKEEKTMKTVLHKSATRGDANHGWLKSKHSFSFANYYNPERMHFGVLRVLNDDIVAAGRGFGTHPHDNMEIISIPLEGDLEHKDSMGNKAVIKQGDVQVLSAGTGIFHSEYNKNSDRLVKFLQIWVYPNKKNVSPRYDQISLPKEKMENDFYQILSPNANDDGVWVHQNAWFNMGKLYAGTEKEYILNDNNNGVYAFILKGNATIEGQTLNERDGFGIWDINKISIKADTETEILLMEVPMNI